MLPASSRLLGLSQSFVQHGSSESGSQQSLLFILGREGPSESAQLQRLPESVLGCLLSVVKEFL